MIVAVEDLLSIPEAANILKLDRSRVGKLCRQGRFAGARKIGSRWVIPREALDRYKGRRPGRQPRTHDEKDLVLNFISNADNLKEGRPL